ncbi:hypothetical protein CFP56_010184 [Quercus suber]|uniref:Uncharacterized protein n=1 Tax=Quercus suber TaxID=58331 RepID=A0AAW0L203_QUESU
MSLCMSPDTTNVVKIASSEAHLWLTTCVIERRVGLYIVTRKILVTIGIHLLPQKSCSEVERPARATKCPREIDGSEHKGPLPKANSKSLKLASQAMKKAAVPPR